jgi:hypothetical protein
VKVGELLLLSRSAAKEYGSRWCIFLGYEQKLGRTYVVGFVGSRKVLLLGGEIHWDQDHESR